MTDESYIRLAIEIAKKGAGKVSPNPMVGVVIVKNERILGAGFHEKFGSKHAEINAIEKVKENIEGATLFTNLEPCSHYGKTPPCVDRIISEKIKRVVIGTLDMNPLISGKGVKKLKSAGIDVKVGVLENECIELNKFFFKYVTKKLPYVSLKAAQTIDGKIADKSGESSWISSLQSRKYVHSLRAKYDAVLVGKGTVEKDDPKLTVRLVEGRNPKRVILDANLDIKLSHRIFTKNNDRNLIVITSKKNAGKKRKINKLNSLGALVLFAKEESGEKVDLKSALRELYKIGIASVLVEGGSEVFTSFVKENLFDDMLMFISPRILGCGVPLIGNLGIKNLQKSVKAKIGNVEKIGDDILLELLK
ncbi:MAG: riboflavin biosynthesis protein RibD [Ignavibacteria bacterium GWA2_35_9]|nr:MAG: riboflavin biosynthesis protein RibD [Ignavibacteria bacterium GWA2_35_9]OGU47986.1 MAG: riboflavin biosynthesis protein RibD [Ignavibacteria bacterium GWB2_36_8]OGU51187.1 MAG: riboflavin biosynthesis protein RibD [Ignavibacteria bacterium GWC2_36_12]